MSTTLWWFRRGGAPTDAVEESSSTVNIDEQSKSGSEGSEGSQSPSEEGSNGRDSLDVDTTSVGVGDVTTNGHSLTPSAVQRTRQNLSSSWELISEQDEQTNEKLVGDVEAWLENHPEGAVQAFVYDDVIKEFCIRLAQLLLFAPHVSVAPLEEDGGFETLDVTSRECRALVCLSRMLVRLHRPLLLATLDELTDGLVDSRTRDNARVVLLELVRQLPPLPHYTTGVLIDGIVPRLECIINSETIESTVRVVRLLDERFASELYRKNVYFIGENYLCTSVLLGAGNFAQVFLGRRVDTAESVAIKVINWGKLKRTNKTTDELMQREIKIMSDLPRHVNIVELCCVEFKGPFIFLVMEYCAGGTLADYLQKNGRLAENVARHFIRELAGGLSFLREKNIVHRDLKPANIMLHAPMSEAILKISDFGFAKFMSNEDLTHTMLGSPLYMAPEIFNGPYNDKTDLWSVGCVLYEMLVGHRPIEAKTHAALHERLARPICVPPEVRAQMSSSCYDLLCKLLRKDPRHRIGWSEFFAHEFVRPPPRPIVVTPPSVSPVASVTVNVERSTVNQARDLPSTAATFPDSNGSLESASSTENAATNVAKQSSTPSSSSTASSSPGAFASVVMQQKLIELQELLAVRDRQLDAARQNEAGGRQRVHELLRRLRESELVAKATENQLQERLLRANERLALERAKRQKSESDAGEARENLIAVREQLRRVESKYGELLSRASNETDEPKQRAAVEQSTEIERLNERVDQLNDRCGRTDAALAAVRLVAHEACQYLDDHELNFDVPRPANSAATQSSLSDEAKSSNQALALVSEVSRLHHANVELFRRAGHTDLMAEVAHLRIENERLLSEQVAHFTNAAHMQSSFHAKPSLAVSNFAIGDWLLFLPNEKGVYEAFNRNSPHFYLAEESLQQFQTQRHARRPIWGSLVAIEEMQVGKEAADRKRNPYRLPDNTHYHVCLIFPLEEAQK